MNLRCYVCGESMSKRIGIVTDKARSMIVDRVFLVCTREPCIERLASHYEVKIYEPAIRRRVERKARKARVR